MEPPDDLQETQPLREQACREGGLEEDNLRVLDVEKHVLDPANPREIMRWSSVSVLDQRNSAIVGGLAVLSSITAVVCWAVLGGAGDRHLVSHTIVEAGPVVYDFVGEGNCKPDLPQWAQKVRYHQCQATCDAAAACIGFDWDARWTFCRVRFATNTAILSPPRGFKAIPGEEGGRIARQAGGHIAGIEGSHTAGCFQKATSVPFHRFLSKPHHDSEGHALVGPLPSILEYYRETGLLGQLRRSARHLEAAERGLLACNSSDVELILPSLDATPLLNALRVESLDSITMIVGLNSDSQHYGLGLAIEASPQINETKDGTPFVHNWYGAHRNRNVIKFHPDMTDGQLSIEGPGGFGETPIGFVPLGWTKSGSRLTSLEITTSKEGNNELLVKSTSGTAMWGGSWRHRLFDGKDIPSLYAFIDFGGQSGKPLLIGRVSLQVWT